MTDITRRAFMAATSVAPMAASVATGTRGQRDQVASDLERYVSFGNKPAGGIGDQSAGKWLASELEKVGFTIERQPIEVPYFDADRCELKCGDAKATVWPQPIVKVTGTNGVTGPIVRVDANGGADADLDGAIALIDLAYARWSSVLAKPIRDPVTAAFAGGARAAVIVTNGPTGKVIALNADGRKPMFAGPVALLAPADAKPFFAAARSRAPATLFLTGRGGTRPAFNFVGRIDRGRGRWLAVSTPRSGWFTCAGERGSGIAAWLWLARWAALAVKDHDLAFICNTGHEYEYLGAAEALKAIAPRPEATRFWLHIGANVASRDWHEVAGKPVPLPSVDAQRYLAISPALLPQAQRVFAGHVGLEAPYSSAELAAGELVEVLAAGYAPAAGVFGIHRNHHTVDDTIQCVSDTTVAATSLALQALLETLVIADAES